MTVSQEPDRIRTAPPPMGIDTHRLVRLVDESWVDRGAADKLTAHSAGGQRHRAFSAFLFRSDGRLLLQQRAATKYHWPSVWSNTCCGHPASTASALDDAATRIGEELGLTVRNLTEAQIVEYRFTDPDTGLTEWEVNHVVFGITDDEPDRNPDEVDAYTYVDAAGLARVMRDCGVSAWFGSVFAPLVTSPVFTATELAPAWSEWTERVRATETGPFLAAVDAMIEDRLRDERWAQIPYADSPVSPAALARRLNAAGGRRMRPLLVLYGMLLFDATTDDLSRAVPVAAAVELFHLFGLLQDDVMDRANLRRGQATATRHVVAHHGRNDADANRYGDTLAILAGDLCAGVAEELISGEAAPIRTLWAQLFQETVVAQYADVTAAARAETDPAVLDRIANYKTGRYSVYLPLALGALLARPGLDPTILDGACDDIGVAFQLADDLRDHLAAEITGKDQHLDSANGRTTYADVVGGAVTVADVIDAKLASGCKRLRAAGCNATRIDELNQLLLRVTA